MNLQKVAPALIEHLAETGSDQLPMESSAATRRRMRRNALWGTAIMFTGIAYGIVGKIMIHVDMVSGAGALVAITGMFWLVYQLLSARFGLTPSARDLSQPGRAPEAKTTAQLTPERVMDIIPSVAERTTDLLANAPIQSVEGRHSDELRVQNLLPLSRFRLR
jgi:hypothetical protein